MTGVRSRVRSAGRGRTAAVLFAIAGWAAIAWPAGASAQRSWLVEEFEADILVLETGRIVVTETIRPTFNGSYNGIFRTIPTRYSTPLGFGYDLILRVRDVTDASGTDLRYETDRGGGELEVKVWVPGAENATRTVILTYEVERGLRHFDADSERDGIADPYDELYWNVTGNEWPVPIRRASATIRLPVAATGIRAHAFTGVYGSAEQDANVTIDGTRIQVRTDGELGYREGLTVGVAWDAGVVERPGPFDEAVYLVRANWPLALPVAAFFGMFALWRRRGKDPEIGSIQPLYEPPEGLAPAELGVVADNSADMRDITSTIVDLAVRGYLTIREQTEKRLMGLFSDTEYSVELARGRETWSELRPHERSLLDAMFDAGEQEVHLSDLKNRFYKHLPGLKDELLDALVHHGVYDHRPDQVAGRWIGLALVAAFVIIGGGLALSSTLGLAGPAVVLGGGLSALIIAAFGVIMPARTAHGAQVLRGVRGFEEFLERVESDRFRRMITGPEMFERYLPFAMALGVEDRWASAFSDMYREPPAWYHGGSFDSFSTRMFVSDLSRMSGQTASVMKSAPRSSSGSSSFGGGSGGGFSGGGFGGGGGGAF